MRPRLQLACDSTLVLNLSRERGTLSKADEALRKAQDERANLEQELKEWRTAIGGASSGGFRAGPRGSDRFRPNRFRPILL